MATEPTFVRSIRLGMGAMPHDLDTETCAVVATQTLDVGAYPLHGSPGHKASPGTYLHRDDVALLLERAADELAQRPAVSVAVAIKAIAGDIRTRGA